MTANSQAERVAVEVAHAEESARVMELLGRPLSRMADAVWEATHLARELSYEAERDLASARPGLVSVPTSDTRSVWAKRSGLLVQSASQVMREALGLFDPATDEGRIARLRRAVGFSARCHGVADVVRPDDRVVMVTLTYRGDNDDWNPRHVSEYLKRTRQWLARRGQAFRYVWVAELQKRGVIHYHVAIWLPEAVTLPMPDKCGWWPHGMTNIETARAAVPYLMKYLSKGSNSPARHRLPLGARAYGVGGLEATLRLARRWLSLPGFIRARCDIHCEWKRAPGGGWTDPAGKHWASEYARVFAGDRWAIERVLDHGRPFDPSGPFSWLPGPAEALGALH